MEGVVQYRLLGDHPAASGRYLTLGFPGETTTKDKILEQVIREHRVNTSRYKLEVRKLVSARDAPGGKNASLSTPPPPLRGTNEAANNTSNAGNADESIINGASSRDAVVAIVLHENEELHTYDRLTITVSQRQLADDDATRKEQEQLERQRRVREMEEELLVTTSSVLPPHAAQGRSVHSSSNTPPPSSTSGRSQDLPRLPGHAAGASVDPLRLQRAAALASQLYPIKDGQSSNVGSVDDPANTHQCVLCRLPAFEEKLASCCRFCVCSSCYVSATEMDMEEGRCPVCGARNSVVSKTSSGASVEESAALRHGGGSDVGGDHKRGRGEDDFAFRTNWKREGADESKDSLQRIIGFNEKNGDNQRRDAVDDRRASSDALQRSRDPAVSPQESSAVVPKEVLQTEERLRHDLEKALASLDGPDTLPAGAKSKRVISAELAALCE
ncbi:hypothetical protein ABL78_2773 [Leptomonas seymouri]|uniref:RING-type domain-containing protein n=1 Tax=Leptomonas seymouri TaxID=5684 RepID=A0A0N1ILE8_LEPSE|nr:hypothetical protein ABL78_2773 [Leptomonas seymouri]|eukprot:KPI88140.1 hypothetical protein ABL78_2773 [Leptomonas seymouri]